MSDPVHMNSCLYRWVFEQVPPERCLAYAAGPLEGLVRFGYSYTSATCRFFELIDGKPHERGGATSIDLSRVFELRMFSNHFDITWSREGGTGRLVIVTDDGAVTEALGQDVCDYHRLPFAIPTIEAVTQLENQYLLWGECFEQTEDGWSCLAAPRVGTLWVPIPLTKGGRGVLLAREYFKRAAYGNVVFCGERLLGIGEAAKVRGTKTRPAA
jgi:CRISPR-associated protein (TIGR03984 family)